AAAAGGGGVLAEAGVDQRITGNGGMVAAVDGQQRRRAAPVGGHIEGVVAVAAVEGQGVAGGVEVRGGGGVDGGRVVAGAGIDGGDGTEACDVDGVRLRAGEQVQGRDARVSDEEVAALDGRRRQPHALTGAACRVVHAQGVGAAAALDVDGRARRGD